MKKKSTIYNCRGCCPDPHPGCFLELQGTPKKDHDLPRHCPVFGRITTEFAKTVEWKPLTGLRAVRG